jgi:hypothetical protein
MDEVPEAWKPQPKAKDPALETLPAMELPHSKALARLRYNEADHTLIAEFRNGSVYRYFGVSRDDYTKLATAASPGARFNKSIQPYHEFEEL